MKDLHLVIILATHGAEADGKNTVVELGAASVRGEHAGLVELESTLVGLDGHGDRADLKGGRHGAVVASHILVAVGGAVGDSRAGGLASATSALASGVGVGRLSAEAAVLGDPGESVVLEATQHRQ